MAARTASRGRRQYRVRGRRRKEDHKQGRGRVIVPCACSWGMEARTASMARREHRVRGRRRKEGHKQGQGGVRDKEAGMDDKRLRKNEERACAARRRTHPSWRACHGARQSHPRHRHRIQGRRRTLVPQSPGRHRNLGPQSRRPCRSHPGATTHKPTTHVKHTQPAWANNWKPGGTHAPNTGNP